MNQDELSETKSKIDKFYLATVIPAFEELKRELEKSQRKVNIDRRSENSVSIIVSYKGEIEFDYTIQINTQAGHSYPYTITRFRAKMSGMSMPAHGVLRMGAQNYTVTEVTKDEIVQNFLKDFGVVGYA